MNKYNKLINNSIIFMIGNFGSKFINLIMVPLYTNVLTTSEYGVVDLTLVTVNLILPIITIELGQAIIRFSIKNLNYKNHAKILSLFLMFGAILSLMILLVSPLLAYFNVFGDQLIYFVIYLILSIFTTFYSQFTRGIGLVKEYAFNGIMMTVITVVSNFLLLVVINLGVDGYLISLILAQLASLIYFFIITDTRKHLKNFEIDFSLFKEMGRYSFPLIPNGTMLWLINSSSRYFILYFVGTSGNGLFSVANKIPQALFMVTNIFSQAWQLSSFEEFESKNKGSFYTNILSIYSTVLFLGGSLILIFLKPFMDLLIDESFFEAWMFVPILLLSVIYQSFNAFLGTVYTSIMETKKIFTSSLAGALVSVISNIILIPTIGVMGAAFASLLAFMVMTIYRLVDTRKYVKIDIDYIQFFANNLIYLLQTILLFAFSDKSLILLEIALFSIMVLVNRKSVLVVFETIFKMIRTKLFNRK